MADKIKQEDVIDSSIPKTFKEFNEELSKSVKLMDQLTKSAIDLNRNFDANNLQQVIDSQKEYNKLNEESQKQNKEAASTLENLRKKIEAVNEEEERAKIALQEKRKAIRDNIKAQKEQAKETVILTRELQKEIKTEREAAEQNKRLIKIRKDVDSSTAKGAKQVSLINKQIDKNNKLIKNNASGLEKQKIGIGKYKDGVKEALAEQDLFGTSFNKLSGLFKSGAGLIGAAVGVISGLAKAYTSSARGAEDLARATDRISAVTTKLGNSIADATGDVGIFDAFIRKLQQDLFGLSSTLEADVIVAIKSQIRQLGILEADQERQKKKQLQDAEKFRQIRDEERNDIETRKKANKDLGNIINEREKATIKFQEDKLKKYQELLEFDKGNIEIQEAIKQIEFEIADAREEAEGFRSEQLMNDMALSREFATNELELQKLIADSRLQKVKEGSVEEFNIRKELIDKTLELELQAAGENEQLRQIALQKAKNETDALSQYKLNSKINENENLIELIEQQDEAELEKLNEKFDSEAELETEKLEELNELRAEKYQEDVENAKAADEEKKMSTKDYIDFAIGQAQQLSNSIFGFVSAEIQNEQTLAIEKAKARGASEEEIAKIEKKYAEKRKKLAITQAIINTALGVTQALNNPFPLNLIMAAIVAAAGALEIATISNAKFAKGTKDSGTEGQIAWVGERGTEIVRHQDGTQYLTPNKATLTYLPPHSEVVPNHRLQNELAEMQAYGSLNRSNNQQAEDRRKQEHKEMIKAIKNRDETYVNISENGLKVIAKSGVNRTDYLARRYRK